MNEVTIDGVRYVAKKSPAQTCAGCAGRQIDPRAVQATELCRALPLCNAADRADRRAVVWVKEAAK